MTTALAIAATAALAYLLGYGRGYQAAVQFLAHLSPQEENDPWAEAQRESAWLQ